MDLILDLNFIIIVGLILGLCLCLNLDLGLNLGGFIFGLYLSKTL